jgi:N-(2-amino-2-carboxyethyl)-L-glutamate synthase
MAELARKWQAVRGVVGQTPMLAAELTVAGTRRRIQLKAEWTNPTGSVKDRTAYGLVGDLIQRGRLAHDSVLVESTSGNLGAALAFLSWRLGLRFIAVTDPKVTRESIHRMRQFRARVEPVTEADATGGYLLTRLSRVRELLAADGGGRMVWTDQYSSPANPDAHYSTTAPELLAQMDGMLDAVFIAVSTGGTLAGSARYLREVSPATRIVAVDAEGSVALGGTPGPRHLNGIGSSRRAVFVSPGLYDACVKVTDVEAFTACRAAYASAGLRIGGSGGAVLVACARYLAAHPEVERAACLLADSGANYGTSIFSDAWLAARGVSCQPGRLPFRDLVLCQHAVTR